MRKTLFAMLGLVALGLWAMPAVAVPTSGGLVVDAPAKVHPDPIPLESRGGTVGAMARNQSYAGTLSGTLIKQTAATTSWFLYPGACVERTLNTWVPKSTPVGDSLQATAGFPESDGSLGVGHGNYTPGQPDISGGDNTIAYTRSDNSLAEILFHVAQSTDPVGEFPAIIDGNRMLWCGKFDANWVVKVGYPNLTAQILYIDTGTHVADYNLEFDGSLSVELNYDYVNVLGGGSEGQADHADPLQNRRDYMDNLHDGGSGGGPHSDSELIVIFTGSIQTAAQGTVTTTDGIVLGAGAGQPNTVHYNITVHAANRAVYFYMTADCLFSSEDGLWPEGNGQQIDNVSIDAGTTFIYDEQAPFYESPPAGVLPTDQFGGKVVIWSGLVIPQPADDIAIPIVSCRVPAGIGELWQLASGTDNPTADVCAPQKAVASDLFFEGGDPGFNWAINKQFNSVVTCAFPVPVGTASLLALWTEYLDLPRFAGFVQYAEYRFFKDGSWSLYQNSSPGGGVVTGALQAWTLDGDELAAAVQADSVQIRYNLQCIPPFAADRTNCSASQVNPLLYDNFVLQVTTGVPAPLFGIFPGAVAQTNFVDGTDVSGGTDANCAGIPCWPGNRGTGLGAQNDHNIAVHDNWNAPTGDSITLAIVTGLRKNGMGVNWRRGFDKSVNAGELDYSLGFPAGVARTNGAYNAAYDVPRMIFRIFDPATKTWSPFDSTELVANAVAISGPDTVLIDSEYNMNWPPYDKMGGTLPGTFTVNGSPNYDDIRFLPRGARVQYYFKAVDINGGTSYQFQTDRAALEVADLPTLPGGTAIAPDIIEMRILPSVYAAGPTGSLLSGSTRTPVLNLDGVYTRWSAQTDPMSQVLRGMGVRADRYRHTASGTTAHNFGGHELPGRRPDRLSNFFPNYEEYSIKDSLAAWYSVMIQSGHTSTVSVFSEQDAKLAEDWWRTETGPDGGDRGILLTGDDSFNALLNTQGVDQTFQISLAQNVFGVSSCINAWSGTQSTPYATIDDRFTAPTAGPGLAPALTFTYPIDGGCAGPNKFDGLIKTGGSESANAVAYPSGAEVAGIANMAERDGVGDNDRNKALGYGFSMQFIRQAGIPTSNANYVRSGLENRMRLVYKFITSIRGPRSGQTAQCMPCPTGTNMTGEWNSDASFQTGTYGPLLPLQAQGLATGVEVVEASESPRVNAIKGNVPNPFNPMTGIRFSSAQAGKATVRIFGVNGQLVRTLTSNVTVGLNEVRWNGKKNDGTTLASGVYFYKITFPDGKDLRSPSNLVLVK